MLTVASGISYLAGAGVLVLSILLDSIPTALLGLGIMIFATGILISGAISKIGRE